jgi:hypothetical protein
VDDVHGETDFESGRRGETDFMKLDLFISLRLSEMGGIAVRQSVPKSQAK